VEQRSQHGRQVCCAFEARAFGSCRSIALPLGSPSFVLGVDFVDDGVNVGEVLGRARQLVAGDGGVPVGPAVRL